MTGSPLVPNFSLAAANELAHAHIAHIARRNGIRVLSIKGPVADHYGLREPRVAADADVLVEPGRVDELCELLMGHGWHRRMERDVPTLLGHHSITLIRSNWPNDIDVHRFFPGFFGDRAEVFDALWNSHSVVRLAHTEVYIPSRAGAAVIAALHCVRYTRSERHAIELRLVIDAVNATFTEQDKAEFAEIAAVGHAQWVLAETLYEIGLPHTDDATAEEQRLWTRNRRTVEDGSAVSWLAAVRSAPLHRRPGVIFRAWWISRDDIPRNDPDVRPTLSEAWSHRVLRWRRGARAIRNQWRDR